MTTEELKEKTDQVKRIIGDIIYDYKKETGLSIVHVKASLIDANSQIGPDFIPGKIELTVNL